VPTPTGRYEEIDGTPVVRFERVLAHPPAAVWAAITEPSQLASWFPTSVEFAQLAAGEAIEFHFPDDAYPPMRGAFREVDPPRRLEFSWGDDVLVFALAEADGGRGCRLSFTVALDSAAKAARDAASWDTCLDGLAASLSGAPQRPAHDERWSSYYAEYQAAGLPAGAEVPPAPGG